MPAAQDPGPQWLRIEDFSPGCYSASGIVVGNDLATHLPAPLGAADAANTYSCFALPSKALAALPGVTQTYPWPTDYKNPGTTYIVGCLVHDELLDGTTEAVMMSEYHSGATSYWEACSYILETASTHSVASVTYSNAAGGIFGSPYPAMTRTSSTSSNNVTGMAASNLPASGTGITTVTVAGTYTVGEQVYFTQLPNGIAGIVLGQGYPVVGTGSGTVLVGVTTTGTWSSGGVLSTVGTGVANPAVVFPGPGTTNAGHLWVYPNPNTPTTYAALDIINSGTAITGQVVCHNSRIVTFTGTGGTGYGWPAGGGFNTNENVFYTDPPLSTLYTSNVIPPTIFSPENPYGYGAAGSISAGELFVSKKRGGGLIVTGDLYNPSVTVLPGVTSTGNIYGQGASTTAGFVYCSYENGCWSWNGSNTSQKLSTTLDDGFFLPSDFDTMQSNNYGFFVSGYRSKVYVSNNWMMDTNTGAWWTYYPRKSQGGADLFYTQTANGDYVYATKLSFLNTDVDAPFTTPTFMYRFDQKTAASTYQWQSLPLHLAPVNQVVDVRQVIVRASNAMKGGVDNKAQVTISIVDNGEVIAGPFTQDSVVGSGPQLIRFNVGALGCYEPSVRINVNAQNPTGVMPTIHGIDMQYNISNHLPSSN